MRLFFIPLIVLATIFSGCSGSTANNPISPSTPTSQDFYSSTNRHLWGLWDVAISSNRQTVELAPLRTTNLHLNALGLLETKPCTSCLKISNITITAPNELSLDLTLTHPYPGLLKFTGFDVRGIFISTADYTFPSSGRKVALGDTVPRMLDPDGFTSLFNPTEFPPTTPPALGYIPGKHATGGDLNANLNPFVAYRKDAPRRMFESGGSETKTIKLHTPNGPIHFGYAVDVCWQLVDKVVDPVKDFPPDANCLEAYAISAAIGPGLQPYAGSSSPIEVEVFDHQGQDSILAVTIEAPDLFNGESALSFSTTMPDGGFLYTGALFNDLGAASGVYPVLVKVTDKQSDQNLGDIAAWQVSSATVNAHKGWARTWGGTDNDWGDAVAVDFSGNLYVTGQFQETVDFDPGLGVDERTSNGYKDVFLSKFGPDGNFLWARSWGGSDYDEGLSVAIDGSGDVYISGSFSKIVDFDPGLDVDEHIADGGSCAFLSKFDPNGNFVWARTWGGGIGGECGFGVAVDTYGNPYVVGDFFGPTDFDPGPDEFERWAKGVFDIFLSKFDSSENFQWACTWGGYGDGDEGYSVAIDNSGDAYVTGSFGDIVDFDPGAGVDNHTSNANRDAFLSKLDPNGNFIWARTWGGLGDDTGNSVAVDGSKNPYVTGSFQNVVDFDPGAGEDNHMADGYRGPFLSKLDSNGNFVWARTWAGSSAADGNGVAIDVAGNAHITGWFWGITDFDPGASVDNHVSNGHEDAFLTKFDPDGNFIWARTWGGPDTDEGSSVATDGSGDAYITGFFTGTEDFDTGPGVDKHNSNGDYDAFLSKFPPDGNW